MLQKEKGMVRSVDVARHLDVSKPSVCHAVSTLKAGGFLTMDENSFLFLTDVGREVVDPQTAEREACRMEHTISQRSFELLKGAVEPE